LASLVVPDISSLLNRPLQRGRYLTVANAI
jgi:hypothetical protein